MLTNDEETMFIHDGDEITFNELREYINAHQSEVYRYKQLRNQYKSEPPILRMPSKERYKPDNRIVSNFGKKLIDTFNGFYSGVAPKVTHENETVDEAINNFWIINDFGDVFSELSKITSLYGVGYLYVWQDEKSQTRVIHNDPFDMFVIYDDTIENNVKYGVRYKYNNENRLVGTLFTQDEIIGFGENWEERQRHYYPIVPIIPFVENDERQSLIKPAESMINAYNKALSELGNDVDYFADAYLAILGAELDEEGTHKIRDNRIINLFGTDDASKIVVEFLNKPDGSASQEKLLNILEDKIFKLTIGFNPSGESYTQSSGVALDKMTLPMQNLAGTKERKFRRGLNSLFKCFTALPTNVPISQSDEWIGIEYTFTRNLPRNINEEAEVAKSLEGIVSKESQLSVLSIIEDTQKEIDKIEEENKLPEYDYEMEQEVNPDPSEDIPPEDNP
ncbi:phage portal protein [Salinicoccus albus]|uniref:phage portal protein n=1 Tax=Salinicoccus albus TaxID=418756 RepID=UPI00036A0B27|nr:phage portal protein [Salinicoccus albus]